MVVKKENLKKHKLYLKELVLILCKKGSDIWVLLLELGPSLRTFTKQIEVLSAFAVSQPHASYMHAILMGYPASGPFSAGQFPV